MRAGGRPIELNVISRSLASEAAACGVWTRHELVCSLRLHLRLSLIIIIIIIIIIITRQFLTRRNMAKYVAVI